MREELLRRMRCLADVIPKNARLDTMLTTASTTSSCIIEKPAWVFICVRRSIRIGHGVGSTMAGRSAQVSSEKEPRPCYERFQQLMDRFDPASIDWWANATAACHAALLESRGRRLEFELHGSTKTADEAAQLERRENELKRLADRFKELQDRNRLPPT